MKKLIFLASIIVMTITGNTYAQTVAPSVDTSNINTQEIAAPANTVPNTVSENTTQANTTPINATQAPIQNNTVSDASEVSSSNQSILPTQTSPLNQVIQSQTDIENPLLGHDLTVMGMYKQAHPVVKGVMIGLFLASIATWTILLAKGLELFLAKRKAKKALIEIVDAKNLASLVQKFESDQSIGAYMVRMTEREVKLSLSALDSAGNEGLKERISSQLSQIESHASRRMARGTAIVATIGSIGPFVGLFGTVWGIMNSFIGIAQTKTTNLAVVAPGLAEALLATAIGLAAAIPAVMIYNILVRWISSYRQNLADCSSGIERLVSRDLDMRKAHRLHEERVAFAAE